MKILISTDSSCLLNDDTFKNYKDISLFPLNVIIDGEEFIDGVTINQKELAVAMRAGKDIKTSTPPPAEVVDYFEKIFAKGYDYVIHFTISSKLSSMNQLFTNIANEYFPEKVLVIDSYGLSTMMLSQVFYAYDEVQRGAKIEDIIEGIEHRKKTNYLVFIPENLNALKKGGRISPSVAMIGNVLGIKPQIRLMDGELQKDGTVRSVKKAFMDKVDLMFGEYSPKEYDYTFVSFEGKEDVFDYVLNYAKEKMEGNLPVKGILPINVCAHCGIGTIGFIISEKINGKSLGQFL